MKYRLISIQSSPGEWFHLAVEIYRKKITKMRSCEIMLLKSVKQERNQQDFKRQKETQLILNTLKKEEMVILFDEKGRKYDSLSFAQKLANWELKSKSIAFIIGGAFGVDINLKKKAHELISLSDFTLNHQIAMLVVLEQIYRALTICHQIPYHNES